MMLPLEGNPKEAFEFRHCAPFWHGSFKQSEKKLEKIKKNQKKSKKCQKSSTPIHAFMFSNLFVNSGPSKRQPQHNFPTNELSRVSAQNLAYYAVSYKVSSSFSRNVASMLPVFRL
jgi:hypothetical protein